MRRSGRCAGTEGSRDKAQVRRHGVSATGETDFDRRRKETGLLRTESQVDVGMTKRRTTQTVNDYLLTTLDVDIIT